MPTQTSSAKKSDNPVQALVERIAEASRKAGHNYLDTTEKAAKAYVSAGRKLIDR